MHNENKIDLNNKNDMNDNNSKKQNTSIKRKIIKNISIVLENVNCSNTSREDAEFKAKDTKIEINNKGGVNSANNNSN